MTKPKSITTLAILLLILISIPILAGCSNKPLSDPSAKTISPAIETDRAMRGIELATQSADRVKATFSTYYANAIATEQALINYYDERKDWPLILLDLFDDNRNDWPLESYDGDLATVSWEIEKGKYKWNALAKEGFIYWTYPSIMALSDFILSVEAKQVDGPQNGEYGLAFRLLDENNYYLYLIDQDSNYSFQLFNEGEWFTIAAGTISPDILQKKVNNITIVGEGSIFRFYINEIFINEESDQTLSSGKFGIAISLTYPEDQAKFEFDNFEIRSPEEFSETE
jgi:hypothetical protein